MIDLHTHSAASDGTLTPEQLVYHAKENGLHAIALTDHDTTDGIYEAQAAAKKCGITLIPGVELSVKAETEMHIVGLDVDPSCAALQETLQIMRRTRAERSEETARKLQELGFPVTAEQAAAIATGGNVGRAHYARLLYEGGYVESVEEAFAKYLNSGCPAYSNRQSLTPQEGISLIRQAGGIPVIAHLHLTELKGETLRQTLIALRDAGLAAIEGYYSDYTPEMQQEYLALARELGLGVSGGSDFHGATKPHIAIGRGRGNLCIPDSVWEELQTYRW